MSKAAAVAEANGGYTYRCLPDTLVSMLAVGTPVPLFRYRLSVAPETAAKLPVSIKAAWKCEAALTSVIIQFRAMVTDKPMTLKGVMIDLTVTGNATSLQAKPEAAWDQPAQTARWALGDVVLKPGQEVAHRILARFVVQQASTPSPVSVNFAVEGQVLSKTSVTLGSDADARYIDLKPSELHLITGKYYALPAPPATS